jgi:hypothetical protein
VNDYRQAVIEDLRLVILRVLAKTDGNRANSSILQTAVNHVGHNATREQVDTECRTLEQLGAVAIEDLGAGGPPVLVVTLTQRGEDHVARRVQLAGVKRPSLR